MLHEFTWSILHNALEVYRYHQYKICNKSNGTSNIL